ncbi:hypothetical protein LOTGIDRAFT_193359 [Lottia gigantea]|uniref:Cytochrome b-c1 complex subunit 8 n=1 Tax=Lottia gigantea TaxID=225164 RepID=V4BIP1_LOTGI|nr:hypothetical protein LOTGIDRAFT_193359 [Lottia gigantea]ESO88484.1 hypothetical protein LOTGIDRAFT_193359 [Lottia gigantea]
MGMKWGALARMRGVYQYSLSPLEQKAFAGFISAGIPRTFDRILRKSWAISIPLAIYLTIDLIEMQRDAMSRKSYKK